MRPALKFVDLKKGGDRRFFHGHPWIFSNEIESPLKSFAPGEIVLIANYQKKILGWGYINPFSLIAVRILGRFEMAAPGLTHTVDDNSESEISNLQKMQVEEFVQAKLQKIWLRKDLLDCKKSFRLCFGEADELPGLIVDRYECEEHQIFSVQISTAGMETLIRPLLLQIFETLTDWSQIKGLSKFSWSATSVILRNDLQVRKLENLPVEEPIVLKDVSQKTCEAIVASIDQVLHLKADFVGGQKTGLFLDQRQNIANVCTLSKKIFAQQAEIKILDLCCYVGAWSAALAQAHFTSGQKTQITLIDISAEALKFAEQNVAKASPLASIQSLLQDALKLGDQTLTESFDIIICDPPAFAKNKKDLPQAEHAYYKLNRFALSRLKPGGLFVSGSCSGLVSEELFFEILLRAAAKNQMQLRQVYRGGLPLDHTRVLNFSEGNYLKLMAFQPV